MCANRVKGIQLLEDNIYYLDCVQDQILAGLCTTKQSCRAAIYHKLTISCTIWVFIFCQNYKKLFQAGYFNAIIRPNSLKFSIWRECSKEAWNVTCGLWTRLKQRVHHLKDMFNKMLYSTYFGSMLYLLLWQRMNRKIMNAHRMCFWIAWHDNILCLQNGIPEHSVIVLSVCSIKTNLNLYVHVKDRDMRT